LRNKDKFLARLGEFGDTVEKKVPTVYLDSVEEGNRWRATETLCAY
jgi:hypothetical protein